MNLEKANTVNHEEIVSRYNKSSMAELMKISPLWAFGNDVEHLLDTSQHPEFGSCVVYLVGVTELIKTVQFGEFEVNKLFTGNLASDYRVASTLLQWEKKAFVDPPTINLQSGMETCLSISDGRHRTKLAFCLGHEKIPVAIPKFIVSKVSNIIHLEPLK